ncbi:hypothetical protein [Enterovibrio norvegicus]|nr:hypothetical protein [Enterovibrio norvegicus]
MSHLVNDLIKAHAAGKSIHLGPLSGSELRLLLSELRAAMSQANA